MFSHLFLSGSQFDHAQQIHPDCCGAYFCDLDGNNLCVVCNEPEQP